MEGLLVFNEIIIHSKLKDYNINFTDDIFTVLKSDLQETVYMVIDSNIYNLFRIKFKSFLKIGIHIIVEATEPHKSYEYCGKIMQELLDNNIRKNNKIIAIGGGIIQDIVAFSASIMFRGIMWSYVPTTLLAQADSCIGGKTSINFGNVKNKLGNFYPPTSIYIDTKFLNTLSIDDIKSGIGEMLHFFLYANSKYTKKIYNEYNKLLTNRSLLEPYILESLRIKKSVIEIDEFDQGERNKFNYGHTFGHALESISNFEIKHGQAVTIGMDIANMISNKLGLVDEKTYLDLKEILRINFPEYNLIKIDNDKYIELLKKDKKNIDDQLVCILPQGPGNLLKLKIPINNDFKKWIREYFTSK